MVGLSVWGRAKKTQVFEALDNWFREICWKRGGKQSIILGESRGNGLETAVGEVCPALCWDL